MFRLLALAVVAGFLEAWGLMLIVGVLHAEWWAVIPTMGFGTALVIVAAITVCALPLYAIKMLGAAISSS